MSSTISFCESEIPVPWGHIAVKAWGNSSAAPVLVIHGIADNAGSFDRLIPSLPQSFYYYCIDLPGHGKSSHFCPGVPLEFFHYVYTIKIVVEHLQWTKFTLMGHSLGAQISVFYSSLYPEKVLNAILIDGLTPLVMSEKQIVPRVRAYFDSLYDLHKVLASKKPPSYTYEEAFGRLKNNRNTRLTPESAETLLQRSLITSGNGYRFSTDQRLKLFLKPALTMQQMKSIVMNMKCPTLMIIAKDTYNLLDATSGELYHERLQKLFLLLPNFTFVLVEGNHDVHMNYPKRLVPYINDFMLNKSLKSNL